MGGFEPQAGTDRVVLVVDGEHAERSWLAGVLLAAGIGVVVVGDGRAAVRIVADGRVRPDVLLTEIELPGMTGVELAARLTASRPAIRVVMMTDDPIRAATARDHAGLVSSVLLKPIDVAELLEAIRPDPARAAV
jgi:CheY-like chemotaxis protein